MFITYACTCIFYDLLTYRFQLNTIRVIIHCYKHNYLYHFLSIRQNTVFYLKLIAKVGKYSLVGVRVRVKNYSEKLKALGRGFEACANQQNSRVYLV